MATSASSFFEAFGDACKDVAEWSHAVAAWRIEDIESVVNTWQVREANAYGRDFLADAQTLLKALHRIATAVEISILKMDASRDIARLNPPFSTPEPFKTDSGCAEVVDSGSTVSPCCEKPKSWAAHKIPDKQYCAIKEAHREVQIELTSQAVNELADVSAEDLEKAVKAVKAEEVPSLLAWHKTRQAREEGSDLMAELEAANQPRNASLIPLVTLAQLQALLAQTDTIICQQRTFTALPQDAHNSGAVLDLDAITEPRIIEEREII